MLDSWIIEEINEKEQHREQPYLELPLPSYDEPAEEEKEELERGVVTIQMPK